MEINVQIKKETAVICFSIFQAFAQSWTRRKQLWQWT